MYHGILPVNKPRGLTSHDVVFKLRKILNTKKIGHTGTLDPEVDGVLPICIGQATKISDYVMEMGKTYHAEVTLGLSTTTEDQTGDVLEQVRLQPSDINAKQIDEVLEKFEGWTTQIPPMYSSVKVNGKKLYEYARKGETVARPERKIYIEHIARMSELHFEDGMMRFEIEVTCGKGTYIRTLATDIGKALNVPAHMSRLTRTVSGGLSLEQALSLSEIETLHEEERLQEKLLPIIYGLKALPMYQVVDEALKLKIKNGQKFLKNAFDVSFGSQIVMIDGETGRVMAIYERHPSRQEEIKPKKVFN
ncbi:tRNA pseudouridine(55) synthase TruB [Staphylococcus coagulans]|uniref:tRNA pseudouridine(55) synthase TruB n=1 Tax=Staphylococcus coagulans TaxID=74706 RepID=UPI001BECFFBD|nr:tRNA pseudouridine(55) synthase TruB [Staphylococcus coagulans]MBT2825274.1 tRNA pseudouridine(55) synthase TruB [Staphylococcus coagulans]MBT2835103.1 tRNA pseudouridine(55) synthase TruB [Staphylococcus coagulans]MBT2845840.1 tRNA pseudouridine(55) synthase TruB [Staphylococcus coagulans]MBT2852651.1 tRNA pseudouridine(55) synthase TruB [Staphylococcus coagulans]MBT2863822.1 tRNA pseudouridine(55) synthase TruB [Staphylococcus coagulans]